MTKIKQSCLSFNGDSNQTKSSVILPNGYGVLNYIYSLANELNKISKKVFVPVLSGQNGNSGRLNLSTAQHDLNQILKKIYAETDEKFNIVSHCSSLLYLTGIKEKELWDRIDKIILYSFLSNPEKHFERFKLNCIKYGVQIDDDISDIKPFADISIYENIPVPIYIIHPNTIMNKLRASKYELEKIKTLSNVKSVVEPQFGYEITDDYQTKEVTFICQNYFRELILN